MKKYAISGCMTVHKTVMHPLGSDSVIVSGGDGIGVITRASQVLVTETETDLVFSGATPEEAHRLLGEFAPETDPIPSAWNLTRGPRPLDARDASIEITRRFAQDFQELLGVVCDDLNINDLEGIVAPADYQGQAGDGRPRSLGPVDDGDR